MSMTADAGDSLLLLFFLGLGILMALSLFAAILRGLRVILSYVMLKLNYGDEFREIINDDSAERYRNMSPERQEVIDNLRKHALLRYLSRFTLTLDDEDLLCCGGSQTDTTMSTSNNEVNDVEVVENNNKGDLERNGDIEEGNKDAAREIVVDMAQDDCNPLSAVEYTHISLPLPGCDINGVNICSMATANVSRQAEGEATGPTASASKKWKLTSLFRNKDCAIEKQAIQDAITNEQKNQQQKVEKRCVPIVCAICLTEYEKCDRVSWSSNVECSHVFHEDCVLQWLISLGKKRSMNQLFAKHPPTDEKLLQNQFCPCCRQDFISVKPALNASEESV